jgi:hypothetical protein
MITSQLAVNAAGQGQAKLVATIPFRSKVYLLVAGPGVVRWGTNVEELQNQTVIGVDNGLPQIAGAGVIEREWEGDLCAISNAATTVIVVCPAKDHANSPARLGRLAGR